MSCECHQYQCLYAMNNSCKFNNKCRNFRCYCGPIHNTTKNKKHKNRRKKYGSDVQYASGGGGGGIVVPSLIQVNPINTNDSLAFGRNSSSSANIDKSSSTTVVSNPEPPQSVLITKSNIKDFNPLKKSGSSYYYLNKDNERVELGPLCIDYSQFDEGFHLCHIYFYFKKTGKTKEYTVESLMEELFPPAPVAVSSSGGGGGSATAANKNDTVKVAMCPNQKIITPANIKEKIELINKSKEEENLFVFCYLDKNKSIVELGRVKKSSCPDSNRLLFNFGENKFTNYYTVDCFKKFINDNSFHGSIEEV